MKLTGDIKKLKGDELDKVAGGNNVQLMYAYECSKEIGGCGITFCAIIPGTECPNCKTKDYLIDLSTL